MKSWILLALLLLASPAYAMGSTAIGMILSTTFVVILLILYWMIVAEVGVDKNKQKDTQDSTESKQDK